MSPSQLSVSKAACCTAAKLMHSSRGYTACKHWRQVFNLRLLVIASSAIPGMPQVYVAELVGSLLECMWRLTGPASTILLAYYRRDAAAHDAFWQLMPAYFTTSKVPEASYGASQHPAGAGLFLLARNESILHRQEHTAASQTFEDCLQ